MPTKVFSSFSSGLISPLDVDVSDIPETALIDCTNVEINEPLHLIKPSSGYNEYFYNTLLNGNDTLYHAEFDGGHVIVRSSGNLLKYSEDFEISTWVKTGGIIITANTETPPIVSSDVKRADGGSVSGLQISPQIISQAIVLNDIPESMRSGKFTFSFYLKLPSEIKCKAVINVNGVDYYGSEYIGGTPSWVRLSVTTPNLTLTTTVVVSIMFSEDAAAAGSFGIFGAQLELSDTATKYGPTYYHNLPIYVYYFKDAVLYHLTLTYCLKLTSLNATSTGFLFDGVSQFPNGLFKSFSLYSPYNEVIHTYVYDSNQTEGLITLPLGASFPATVLVSNYKFSTVSYLSLKSVKKISHEYSEGAIRLNLFNNGEPLTISYVNFSGLKLSPENRVVTYSGYQLNRAVFSINDATEALNHAGLTFTSVSFITGGSIATGQYTIYLVAIIGNERFLVRYQTFNNFVSNAILQLVVSVHRYWISPRLTGFELYVSSGTFNEFSAVLVYSKYNLNSDVTTAWSNDAGEQSCKLTVQISSIPTTSNTMFSKFGRTVNLDTAISYDLIHKVRGRNYVSKYLSNRIRFSEIQLLNECNDLYPYSDTEFFGLSVLEREEDKIVAISSTKTGALVFLCENSMFVFSIHPLQGIRELVYFSRNIGCVSTYSVTQTDYGVVWCYKDGVYLLDTGVVNISLGKVAKLIASSKLDDAVGVYLRNKDEYWLFLRDQNDEQFVLRYSFRFQNWNKLKLPYNVRNAVAARDGDIILSVKENPSNVVLIRIGGTYSVTKPLAGAIAVSGKFVTGAILITDIAASYENTSYVGLLLNKETIPRGGNLILLPNGRKFWRKTARISSSCSRFGLMLIPGGDIDSVWVDYIQLQPKIGRTQ